MSGHCVSSVPRLGPRRLNGGRPGPGRREAAKRGRKEQKRPTQHVHGLDADHVQEHPAGEQADEPPGLPDHVEAGERAAA